MSANKETDATRMGEAAGMNESGAAQMGEAAGMNKSGAAAACEAAESEAPCTIGIREAAESEAPCTIGIREATTEDAARLLEIYAYYVERTAITFEYDVPTVEEFKKRIAGIKKCYPYLVIERDGVIEGYAYAGVFKDRAAYDRSCEMTIYLNRNCVHGGLGRKLYEALEEALRRQGMLNLYACIGCPEKPDEYLDFNSAQFHEHLGYRTVGTFHQCGYKFGRWYNMIWMEKMIGEHV